MKNKLVALLTALLLSFSVLSVQGLAVFPTDPGTPPAISKQQQPETPDTLDAPEGPDSPVPQSSVSNQEEDPDRTDQSH